MNGRQWNQEEIKYLKLVYPTSGYRAHQKKYSDRTCCSITSKAMKVGVNVIRREICSIYKCNRKHYSKGLCSLHYNRLRIQYFLDYQKKHRVRINKYLRQWRAKNPDKISKANKKWRSKKENYKKAEELCKKWKKTDMGKRSRKLYVEKNRERIRQLGRNFYRKNKVKIISKNKRLYLKRKNVIGNHTNEEWIAKRDETHGFCPSCWKHVDLKNLTEDHIVSIKNGGTDYIENIQPLCGSCNSSKGAKTIIFPQPMPDEDKEFIIWMENSQNLLKNL